MGTYGREGVGEIQVSVSLLRETKKGCNDLMRQKEHKNRVPFSWSMKASSIATRIAPPGSNRIQSPFYRYCR